MAVSFYLYVRRKERFSDKATSRHFKLTDFIFVIVLAGLLGLYIASINRTSSLIFALGNIVVEGILVVYTVRNRTVGA